MTPLHLLIHAPDAATAERLQEALRRADPGLLPRIEVDRRDMLAALARPEKDGAIAAIETAPGTTISPTLRHELNNHLALIRMLADVLCETPELSAPLRAKAQEIGTAAEAAAIALRRTKPAG